MNRRRQNISTSSVPVSEHVYVIFDHIELKIK